MSIQILRNANKEKVIIINKIAADAAKYRLKRGLSLNVAVIMSRASIKAIARFACTFVYK